jgi:hypothetical protein
MRTFVVAVALVLGSALTGQQPAVRPANPAPAPAGAPSTKPQPIVQFDPSTGWPVGVDDGPQPGAVAAKSPARKVDAGGATTTGPGGVVVSPLPTGAAPAGVPTEPASPALASGTQLGSPLLDVYQPLIGPGEWRRLGGLAVSWRATVHGPSGEVVGVREFLHVADPAYPDRDRIEHQDGRVYVRCGQQVFAERDGMPMPAATEEAARELALFGMQLRMPWAFADANAYAVTGKQTVERGGEKLRKLAIEQRPPHGADLLGPESQPRPRDTFEIYHDTGTGRLREFVHRFAATEQTRRVLLEDWRDADGVQLPHRRVYLDDAERPTTVLEIVKVERRRVAEREFRQP